MAIILIPTPMTPIQISKISSMTPPYRPGEIASELFVDRLKKPM
ncbi:hypothetical protein LT85_3012 [Collimonas arenae]|uniref:Uncharacterized protein n=1 Tax=Collimonas arenae TaxID=279058 RepID=A0A0A1FEF0_9BURK|nr:hypothetical protein LT85_3012 [Collimonas arenae]